MSEYTPEQREELKRAIYERMSPRRRKFVDRLGYDNWDPFQEPNHPIDIRRDATGRTGKELTEEFLADMKDRAEANYLEAVSEFTITLLHNPDRIRPIFDFCVWYNDLLNKAGKKL